MSISLRRALLALALTAGMLSGLAVVARATVAYQEITSSGPLTRIMIGADGSMQIAHQNDARFAYFPSDVAPGDAGTFLAVGELLFAPNFSAHDRSLHRNDPSLLGPYTPFAFVSQSEGDPHRIITVLDAGSTDLRITQTDFYVVGQEAYRTDIEVANLGTSDRTAILYRAGDCFFGGGDFVGYGHLDVTTRAVACAQTANNSPPARVQQFLPITGGNNYLEAHYADLWRGIGRHLPFPDTCVCTTGTDSAMGISWTLTIPPGGRVTRSHLTNFSPSGTVPLTMTKQADSPSSAAGGTNGYTITVTNPNATSVTLTSILDTLPPGFTYVPDSTAGVTTSNPIVGSGQLTWNGPFTVPAGTPISLHFQVIVTSTPGTYTNRASATATGGYTVAPTGDTAPITVQEPAPPTRTPTVTATPTATACPGLTIFDLLTAPRVTDPTPIPAFPRANSTLVPSPVIRPQNHFRSSQLTWTRVNAATAEFRLTAAAQVTHYTPTPVVGSVIDAVDVDFGDGVRWRPPLTVEYVDVANDYLVAEGEFTHTYGHSGPFIAMADDCCRAAHINNYPNIGIRVETIVNLAATEASPVSSMQPIVDCPREGLCAFSVPAVDPDGQALRFRLATSQEAAGSDPFVQPGPPHAPHAATINATTGLYTWDTHGAALSPEGDTLYSTQVVVENRVGDGVVSRIGIDFFIRLAGGTSNQPPSFTAPTPADRTVLNVMVGQQVSFGVTATDPNSGDIVVLAMFNLPTNAQFSWTAGNPVSGTFTWTPSAPASVILTLGAQDQTGVGATPRAITINVFAGCPPMSTVSPTTTRTPTSTVTPSMTATPTRTSTPTLAATATVTPTPTPTRMLTATPTLVPHPPKGLGLKQLADGSVIGEWSGLLAPTQPMAIYRFGASVVFRVDLVADEPGTYVDPFPRDEWLCYVAHVYGVCIVPQTGSATGQPRPIELWVSPPAAEGQSGSLHLAWTPQGGQDGFVILRSDGHFESFTTGSAWEAAISPFACYFVFSLRGSEVLGYSDAVCVVS